MRLAVLFIMFIWPFTEIFLFLALGDEIGFINTFLLYILMAFAGGAMIYWQGIGTLIQLKQSLERNIFPSQHLFDAACLAVAGVLMILPGILSDMMAFALMLPPIRYLIRGHLAGSREFRDAPAAEPGVIEGKYSRIDITDKP